MLIGSDLTNNDKQAACADRVRHSSPGCLARDVGSLGATAAGAEAAGDDDPACIK